MIALRALLASGVLSLLTAPVRADGISFTRDIAPILKASCLECHSGKKTRGDLDLGSARTLGIGGANGPVVRAGKAAESLLFQHVRDAKMPPRKPLAAKEIALLKRWIDEGARWEGPPLVTVAPGEATRAGLDWWSLQPIRRPVVPTPTGTHADRARTPIDRFLLSALNAKGLGFSPEADRPTLLRRLYQDLIGLPPTPEEREAFLQDSRPDAYERLVDRLLASPAYGERWGRHWLDVVRFAESHGYEMNTLRPNAWPYRDYVIRSLNQDLPWSRFVQDQIAGDQSPGRDSLTSAATGFLVGGAHDMVGNSTEEGRRQQRADDLFDIVSTTGTTFLGLTVGCARCHDHKFDPISQTDFYALQGFFSGVQHAERVIDAPGDPARQRESEEITRQLARIDKQIAESEPLVGSGQQRSRLSPRWNVERLAPTKARFLRFTILATFDGSEPCIDELEVYGPASADNLALASRGVKSSASSTYPGSALHRLEHLNDGRLGNSRSWISAERGKGRVQLEWPTTITLDRIVWGRDREERFRDRLASGYRIEVSEDGMTWNQVADHTDRAGTGKETPPSGKLGELQAGKARLAARLRELSSSTKIYAGTFGSPEPVQRFHRGDVMQPREIVNPAGLTALRPELRLETSTPEPRRRLALAEWLTNPANPLPARVLANRLWQWHFGQGLVRTPNDFGFNGDRPSHPELLDWLASELQSGEGRLKPLHRLMVLSTAYRQASGSNTKAASIDAGNRLLWRMTPRRLEAEAVRDALLAISGELDRRMGGPGYHLWEYSGYVISFKPKEIPGPDTYRRMVYQFKPRLQQDGTFGAFDCPDGTAPAPRRNISTTALQALNLLNDPFVVELTDRFARRVRREAEDNTPARIDRAFQLAFGRSPGEAEKQAAQRLIENHGLEALCRALFNANEVLFVP